jgi:hypothetical protein
MPSLWAMASLVCAATAASNRTSTEAGSSSAFERPLVRSSTARAAAAARSSTIASTGPAGPPRSSHSTGGPSCTSGALGQSGSGRPMSPRTRPCTSIRTCTRRCSSTSRAAQPASTAAPRTIGSSPARPSTSRSK